MKEQTIFKSSFKCGIRTVLNGNEDEGEEDHKAKDDMCAGEILDDSDMNMGVSYTMKLQILLYVCVGGGALLLVFLIFV